MKITNNNKKLRPFLYEVPQKKQTNKLTFSIALDKRLPTSVSPFAEIVATCIQNSSIKTIFLKILINP